MKQFVYWLSPIHSYMFGQKDNRPITMWADTPEQGLEKLIDWKDRGYTVKYLYPLEEFRKQREIEIAEENELERFEEERAKHASKIEVENV